MKTLTATKLMEILRYDANTGVFTWLIKKGRRSAGDIAGCMMSHGYIQIMIEQQNYTGHSLAWLYMTGKWPDNDIDHKNGVRHDNRFENLRVVTRSVNMQNVRRARRDSKTGILGVSFYEGKFRASITLNGVVHYLGGFDSSKKASDAYLKAKRRLHEGCTI